MGCGPKQKLKLKGAQEDFHGDSDGKESACNAGDPDLIPGLGSSPGEGNGYPLQHSCLENSRDRGAWRAPVHGGHKELDMTEQRAHTHEAIANGYEPQSRHLTEDTGSGPSPATQLDP